MASFSGNTMRRTVHAGEASSGAGACAGRGSQNSEESSMTKSHYKRLVAMTVTSFVAMYVLMYGMVNTLENVYMNVNQAYMAGLMAASMLTIEITIMSAMYHDRRLNLAILVASIIALAGFWIMIRKQTAVSDQQFLRSMIPHHAGAILMCTEAPIRDAEIRRLCESIVSSQRSEIDQMTARLKQLEK
jgi:uncharacterized protein (DUF305 family)